MSADDQPVEVRDTINRTELLKRIGSGVVVVGAAAPVFASSAFGKQMRSFPSQPNSGGSSGSRSSSSANAFRIRLPHGPRAVGDTFTVHITALDGSGKIVTDYDGSVSLSDETGTLSYDSGSIAWTRGSASVDVEIDDPIRRNRITVDDGSASTDSGPFPVVGPATQFVIKTPPAVNTDEPFLIKVKAIDSVGNTVGGFENTSLGLSDDTSTLNVTDTVWAKGVASITATVGAPSTADQIHIGG